MNDGLVRGFPGGFLAGPTRYRSFKYSSGINSSQFLQVTQADNGVLFDLDCSLPSYGIVNLPPVGGLLPGFAVWFRLITVATSPLEDLKLVPAATDSVLVYGGTPATGAADNSFHLCRPGECVGLVASPAGWILTQYSGNTWWDNYAYNPKGLVAQRPTGTAATNASSYGACDRWKIGVTGTVTAGSYVQDLTDGVSASSCIKVSGLSTSSATPIIYFHQYLESKDVQRLKGRVCSFSCWVKHTAAVNVNVTLKALVALAGTDNFGTTTGATPSNAGAGVAGTAVSVPANTWTQIVAPSFSWVSSDPSAGIVLEIAMAVSSGTLTTKDFKVTDVQFQPGAFVMPVSERTHQEELARCMRSFEKSFAQGTAPAAAVGANTGEMQFVVTKAGAALNFFTYCGFKVTKRIAPSMLYFNPLTAANFQARDPAAGDCTATGTEEATDGGFCAFCTGPAGGALGDQLVLHWTADSDF